MIYVLKSAAEIDGELTYLLKIGFTESWDHRFNQYLLHNPTIKPLYLIEGGTELDEIQLHFCLRGYRYEGPGNEWYYYNENVLNVFEDYKTIGELRKFIRMFAPLFTEKEKKIPSWRKRKSPFNITRSPEYNLLIDSIVSCNLARNYLDPIRFFDRVIKRKTSVKIDEVIGLVRKIYRDETDSILNYLEQSLDFYCKYKDLVGDVLKTYNSIPSTIDRETYILDEYEKLSNGEEQNHELLRIFLPITNFRLKQFIGVYGFDEARRCLDSQYMREFFTAYDELETFSGRAKFLCENDSQFSQDELDKVLYFVDRSLEDCYKKLGKNEMASFEYNEATLKERLRLVDLDPTESVLEVFQVGDRLSKASIKSVLRRIYLRINYKASPKAVDLNKWFMMKSIRFKNSQDEWENGFELLSLREQYQDN